MYDHTKTNYEIVNVRNYEDFLHVYRIYTLPPYCEKWTNEEIYKAYENILKNGIVFACYIDSKCVGIIALKEKDQPLKFDTEESAIYVSDLAVLSEYRKLPIAEELLKYAIKYAREHSYCKIYLRTLSGASSYEWSTFKKLGFNKMLDTCQVVNKERTRMMAREDCRFFLHCNI